MKYIFFSSNLTIVIDNSTLIGLVFNRYTKNILAKNFKGYS